ncbi:MAG TPA: hypothetical protein VK553_12050, partial [Candidatus Nitrosopolaris rasttigaisensis]|nr:hypothetical protein [Candidatus Nitrosopolaris rasttigaisensis]
MGKKSLFTKDKLESLLVSNSSKEIARHYNVDPALISYYVKKFDIGFKRLKSIDPLIQWIYDNCFSLRGSLNNKISDDSWWINRNLNEKKKEIIFRTNWLETTNITQRIFHIINDFVEKPKCKTCGNDTKFQQFKSGYEEYCSNRCVTQSVERNAKISKGVKEAAPLMVEKVKATNLKKYGVEYTTQTENFKIKSKITKFERYGNENYNGEFSSNDSQGELELLDFLNSYQFIFVKNRHILKNLEIDAYCEDIKLGIEYCGLYWHNEKYKPNNYHFVKMQRCNEAGIRLITIFEDEWNNKQNQVKQFLKATLGLFDQRFYARNCNVQEIEPNYNFFEMNHVQGKPQRINRCFGLFYQNELSGCVSYARHHRNNVDLTLNRLAFVNGV